MSVEDELLVLEDVWYRYPGGVTALRGVSCVVARGEVLVVLGPNGCGKTTMLLVMAGLLRPTRGVVKYRGSDVRGLGPEIRREIGIVFQDPDDQLFNPTVFEEIAYALRQLGIAGRELEERVRGVSRILGVEHLLDKPPYKLSYGERKRVALASILVYEPALLLLDEPTSSLSPRYARLVEELIEERVAGGGTVVAATQDVDFAYRVADRVCVLVEGRVLAEGEAHEILADEEVLERAELEKPCALRRELERVESRRISKLGGP